MYLYVYKTVIYLTVLSYGETINQILIFILFLLRANKNMFIRNLGHMPVGGGERGSEYVCVLQYLHCKYMITWIYIAKNTGAYIVENSIKICGVLSGDINTHNSMWVVNIISRLFHPFSLCISLFPSLSLSLYVKERDDVC